MSLFPERPPHYLFSSRGASGRTFSDPPSRFRSPTWRTKPYDKPVEPPPPGNSEARWNHDLFEDDSNLYGPRVRYHAQSSELMKFGSTRPSPSLRPFGSTAHPPASTTSPPNSLDKNSANPVISLAKSAGSHPLTSKPHSNPTSGLSLLSRIQSNDSRKPLILNSSSSSLSHPDGKMLNPIRLQDNHSTENTPSGLRRPEQPISFPESIKLHSQSARNQQEFDAAMARYLNGPVILEVANLADGTSAEDVKTAFADFGEIQECTTEEGARQGNQPTLKAKMIFTHKADAEKAVEALNGALADGLTLAVKIIGRPTKKPERSDFMTTTAGNEMKLVKLPTTDTVMKSPDQEDITMGDGQPSLDVTVPTGRLRSEAVAQCDPRASIQVEPKPIPLYKAEQPKPVIRNMFSRVRVSPGNHQLSAPSHHAQQRHGFSHSSHLHPVNHAQSFEPSNSLLARIKPN